MIKIEDGTIAITRGDCGLIAIEIETGGSTYEMAEGDTLELTVRGLPSAESPILLHAESAPGVAQIVLHTEDTQIPPGRYSADIQLNHGECRYTVWPELDTAKGYKVRNLKNFIVGVEVTAGE